LVIRPNDHPQISVTISYSGSANSHTPQPTTAHIKTSSPPPPAASRQRIPTTSSAHALTGRRMSHNLLVKSKAFFFLILWGGTKSLGTAAISGLLYKPQTIDDGDCGVIGGIKIDRGNRSTRKVKGKVRVTLRLTVSQSVSLGVEPHLGLMTRYLLLFDS
jgi:hypothetical protein